jgi:hypothetical protein
METTSPVDGNIAEAVVKLDRATNRSSSIGLAKGIKAVKDGTVFTNIEALKLANLILLGFRGNAAEKRDIVVGVEAAEITVAGREGLENLHMLKETVVSEEGMGHADAMGLHGMTLAIVVIADLRVIEITNFPLHTIRSGRQRIAASIHYLFFVGSTVCCNHSRSQMVGGEAAMISLSLSGFLLPSSSPRGRELLSALLSGRRFGR